ncbi:F-box protein CPR1-like [Rutidosis leptorrhynchoides]|uniref:F-box protein CPR1-like n=1 Tax=Rutidosis leptorrhynchoides TaxID=125765 RepID=UPI003A99C176
MVKLSSSPTAKRKLELQSVTVGSLLFRFSIFKNGNISIPSELITEILYRLPSKSVGQFRCVSKEWLSLLSSPQFIRTHQNTLNRNYLFFHPNRTDPYFIPFHQNTIKTPSTKFHLHVPDKNHKIYGSCNGLVLLSAFRRCSWYETLMVSNPTTREFLELPVCDLKIEGHDFVVCMMRELGYDSVTDDFKVVTINLFMNLNGHDIMCVHVYSFRRNTWTRVIDYSDNYDRYHITSKALVNGSFHWVAKKVPDEIKVIVAFSLADENFSEVPSPTMLGNGNDVDILYKACRVSAVDEKLAIFSMSEGEVWLMNEYGVKGSWTNIKLYGLKKMTKFFLPFVFYVNGKLLLVYEKEMLILSEECLIGHSV